MRVPVIPLIVFSVLVGTGVLLYVTSEPINLALDSPNVSSLIDLDGIETEVAVAQDGIRYAVIVSGDLWFVDLATDTRQKLTETAEVESSPAWTGDGERITFTRGADTFERQPEATVDALYLSDATDLVWSTDDRNAFVRGRALWLSHPDGAIEELVPADSEPTVRIRSPRFSPEGNQIVFLKSMLDLRGEVWQVDVETGNALPVIADRVAENPTSADWVLDDRHIAYLTDRSGGLAVWYIDLDTSTLVPITAPIMGLSLARLGLAVHGQRIVVPRHTLDSDIATSGGVPLVQTALLEFEPSISPDGESISYTVENEGRFEIWVAARDGRDPRYVALGRHPRFSPNGNEIVYARTDLGGNKDIWKVDLRTGLPKRLTDGPAIDDVPDWSPDGTSIIFSSAQDGELSLWTIRSSGSQRLRLNRAGYAPRFSPDGTRITYWHQGALWEAGADGSNPSQVAIVGDPVLGVWSEDGPAYFADGRIHSGGAPHPSVTMWPSFDRLPDGQWLLSPLDIQKTELWTLDLNFTAQ